MPTKQLFLVATIASLAACSSDTQAPAVTRAAMETLATRTIYFAHNSVGNDILGGLDRVMESTGVSLRRATPSGESTFSSAVFADSGVSENGKPLQKISDFETVRMPLVKNGPKYAFFKLCFVDIGNGTNVTEIINAYKASMTRLHAAYPSTTFVHFTVPLCTSSDADNAARGEYNAALRAAYGGKEPIFDLAAAESTNANGSKVTFSYGGKTYQALSADWASNDNCHLSSDGGSAMAEALVKFLASLP